MISKPRFWAGSASLARGADEIATRDQAQPWKGRKKMNHVKIKTEEGNSWKTGFNGTPEQARDYFLVRVFNVGRGPDDYFEKVTEVEYEGEITIQGVTFPCVSHFIDAPWVKDIA